MSAPTVDEGVLVVVGRGLVKVVAVDGVRGAQAGLKRQGRWSARRDGEGRGEGRFQGRKAERGGERGERRGKERRRKEVVEEQNASIEWAGAYREVIA